MAPRLVTLCCILLALRFVPAAEAPAGNSTVPGELLVEPPTLHSVGFEWSIGGDDNRNATVAVDFRQKGASVWRHGMPLLRTEILSQYPLDKFAPPKPFAGSVVLLRAGTSYQFRLRLTDPDGGAQERRVEVTTRKTPTAFARGRTLYVQPGNGGGSGTAADPFRGLMAADAQAKPGDRFLLQAGRYTGAQHLTADGAPGRLIVYQGATQAGVILDGEGARVLLQMDHRKHILLDQMTFTNAETAVSARNTTDVALRRLKIDVRLSDNSAIVMFGDCHDNYVGDCEITGAAPNFPARTPQQTGLFLNGDGHVVCYNRIRNFHDGVSLALDGPSTPPGRAIDLYNNLISEVNDDAIEGDYAIHNIRIYRNKMLNFLAGVSEQPSFAGPMYIFRNEFMNSFDRPTADNNYVGSPLKFSQGSYVVCPTGLLVYHNTSVNRGPGMSASLYWSNSTFLNNLIYGANGPALENARGPCVAGAANRFDYNGWYGSWRNFC
jgi:hypothetical protein